MLSLAGSLNLSVEFVPRGSKPSTIRLITFSSPVSIIGHKFSKMAELQLTRFPKHAFKSLVHVITSAILALLTLRLIIEYFNRPLTQAVMAGLDVIAILCFLCGLMAVYLLSLLSPTDIGESQETSHACVIFMIWASSVPFLHFQFFHTPLLELTLLFIMTFLSVWFSSFVQFSYMRRDSIAACCLLCAIAMLPAIYAILQPTACRYDMAAEYVKLHMMWLSGAICYTMNLPERLGFFVHSHLSLVAMHIIAATASVAFSAHLLRAFQTTSQFTHLCRV